MDTVETKTTLMDRVVRDVTFEERDGEVEGVFLHLDDSTIVAIRTCSADDPKKTTAAGLLKK